MRQRILAIAGAVALVVVAVVVRAQLAGNDDPTSGGGGGGGRRPVVACSPGLEEICRTLADEGLVAADPLTFDLGSAGATTGVVGDTEIDAWITWDPAGDIANFDAEDGTTIWDEPEPVGSSPLAMLTRTDAVFPGCSAAERTWACALRGGETNAIAVGDPKTIDGLLRLQPMASSLLGADEGFDDIDVIPVLDLLEIQGSKPPPFSSGFTRYLTAVGSYQAIVGPAVGLADRGQPTTPKASGGPPASMNLVVTPRVDSSIRWVDSAFSRPAVVAAVRAAGVDPGSATLAGTPDAGQLYALRERLTGP